MEKRLLTLIIILVIVIFAGFVNAENQTCRGEGVKISQLETNILCCDGLTKILPKWEGILSIDGICTAKCGNGVCDEETESSYNCPQDCKSTAPICGNNICEEDEANNPGGCGPNADSRCLGPPARQGTCPEDCQQALNKSCVCTQDAKICPDGSAVSRVCPDCEFALCENKGCDYSSKTKTYLYKDRACLVVDYACVEGEPFTDNCGCGCEKNPKVKVFPETASLRARERLGELGFNISLKEVGKGNNTKMVYEISGKKQGKMFGLFKIKGKVSAEVDAETGEIIGIKKPWWAFLASGI